MDSLASDAEKVVPDDTKHRIRKDVFRTDRIIDFYHPVIGDLEIDLELSSLKSLYRILLVYTAEHPEIDYVQGMNDIASPILYVMKDDESDAYQVFKAVMKRQREYFTEHGHHMQSQLAITLEMLRVTDPIVTDRLGFSQDNTQLFICYRWLLLLFKREFGFYQFPLALETIYSCPTASYELFIALALMLTYREDLLKYGHRFDQTLSVSSLPLSLSLSL